MNPNLEYLIYTFILWFVVYLVVRIFVSRYGITKNILLSSVVRIKDARKSILGLKKQQRPQDKIAYLIDIKSLEKDARTLLQVYTYDNGENPELNGAIKKIDCVLALCGEAIKELTNKKETDIDEIAAKLEELSSASQQIILSVNAKEK